MQENYQYINILVNYLRLAPPRSGVATGQIDATSPAPIKKVTLDRGAFKMIEAGEPKQGIPAESFYAFTDKNIYTLNSQKFYSFDRDGLFPITPILLLKLRKFSEILLRH